MLMKSTCFFNRSTKVFVQIRKRTILNRCPYLLCLYSFLQYVVWPLGFDHVLLSSDDLAIDKLLKRELSTFTNLFSHILFLIVFMQPVVIFVHKVVFSFSWYLYNGHFFSVKLFELVVNRVKMYSGRSQAYNAFCRNWWNDLIDIKHMKFHVNLTLMFIIFCIHRYAFKHDVMNMSQSNICVCYAY